MEHGCSKFEEVVVDRAPCIKFDSRHFPTLPVPSDAIVNNISLHSGGSSHSSTRWESSQPSTINNTLSLDRHHNYLRLQPLPTVYGKRFHSLNPKMNTLNKHNAGIGASTISNCTAVKQTGIPACPIRKLSRESSVSPVGEEGQQQSDVDTTYSSEPCPLTKPEQMLSLSVFDPAASDGIAGRTVPLAYRPTRHTTISTIMASNEMGVSPSILDSTTTPSPLVPTRPPLSPKKKMKNSSGTPTASVDSARNRCCAGAGRKIMVIRNPLAVHTNQENVTPMDHQMGFPSFPAVGRPQSHLPSTSPFALQERETIQGRQLGRVITPVVASGPSMESASDNSLSVSHGVTTYGSSGRFLDRSSPTSAITDYLERPNTGRSLSKTLGVDFHEDAPIQPLRRPSAEPDDQHFPFNTSTSSPLSSCPTHPTANHVVTHNASQIIASQSEKDSLPHFPHVAGHPSSTQPREESQTSLTACPRLDFLPYPLDHASESSFDETFASTSTPKRSNPGSSEYSSSDACGTPTVKASNDEYHILPALFPFDETAQPASKLEESEQPLKDIVFQPITNNTSYAWTVPTMLAPQHSIGHADIPFQYPPDIVLEHPHDVKSNTFAPDKKSSGPAGRINGLFTKLR